MILCTDTYGHVTGLGVKTGNFVLILCDAKGRPLPTETNYIRYLTHASGNVYMNGEGQVCVESSGKVEYYSSDDKVFSFGGVKYEYTYGGIYSIGGARIDTDVFRYILPPVERYSDGKIYRADGVKIEYCHDGKVYSVGGAKVDYYNDGRLYSVGGNKVDYYNDGRIFQA